MWTQRFALALALLIERGEGTEAHLLLETRVIALCRRFRMLDDVADVLQNTWMRILRLMQRHATAPSIANQTTTIIHNEAVNVIRAREQDRKLEALWTASMSDAHDAELDERHIEEELAILLSRLREEHPAQHDAITLALHAADHEEARVRWQTHRSEVVSAENFRQMIHRGTRRLRQYREDDND